MRQREAKISDAIREAVAAMPGVILWRNSPTLAKVRGGRAWCGLPRGSSDLVGIVSVTVDVEAFTIKELPMFEQATIGRFLALEIKAPGEIPTPEDIDRILTKLGPVASGLGWGKGRSTGPAWERAISKLEESDRHVLQQEAWLHSVREIGGFACYVDSVDTAIAAVKLARNPRAALVRA